MVLQVQLWTSQSQLTFSFNCIPNTNTTELFSLQLVVVIVYLTLFAITVFQLKVLLVVETRRKTREGLSLECYSKIVLTVTSFNMGQSVGNICKEKLSCCCCVNSKNGKELNSFSNTSFQADSSVEIGKGSRREAKRSS